MHNQITHKRMYIYTYINETLPFVCFALAPGFFLISTLFQPFPNFDLYQSNATDEIFFPTSLLFEEELLRLSCVNSRSLNRDAKYSLNLLERRIPGPEGHPSDGSEAEISS